MPDIAQGIIVAAFTIIFGAIIAYLVRLNNHLLEVDKALVRLETQVSPLWAKVQAQISSDLHHPHPRYLEMDSLLEKLEALTISTEQRDRLKVLLQARSTDMHEDISEDQRKKAKVMIQVMDLVVSEAKDTKDKEEAGLV